MAYLAGIYTGEEARRQAAIEAPFGPAFTKEEIQEAIELQIWCSNFTDGGMDSEDFTEFRLFKPKDGYDRANAILTATKRIQGY